MRSRFWLSLVSKFLFGLAWVNFISLNIYGATEWVRLHGAHDRYPQAFGEWEGFMTFSKIGFIATMIFMGLMTISGLIQLALDADARATRA